MRRIMPPAARMIVQYSEAELLNGAVPCWLMSPAVPCRQVRGLILSPAVGNCLPAGPRVECPPWNFSSVNPGRDFAIAVSEFGTLYIYIYIYLSPAVPCRQVRGLTVPPGTSPQLIQGVTEQGHISGCNLRRLGIMDEAWKDEAWTYT